MRPSVKVRN